MKTRIMASGSLLLLVVAVPGVAAMVQEDRHSQDQHSRQQDQRAQDQRDRYDQSHYQRSQDQHSRTGDPYARTEQKPVQLTASQVRQVVNVLQERDEGLSDALDKATNECNHTAIYAEARVVSDMEYARKLDKDPNEVADSQQRGQGKMMIEIACASPEHRGQTELVAVCLETDETKVIPMSRVGSMQSEPFSSRHVGFQEEQYDRAPWGEQDRRDWDTQQDRNVFDDWDAWDDDRGNHDRRFGQWRQRNQRQANIGKGSEVIGADVIGYNNEDIGNIEDIAIDPRTGRIKYVVLGSGGFLGMGDDYFAIPWEALQWRDENTYYVPLSQQALKNMPGFNKDNWPQEANRRLVQQGRRFDDRQARGRDDMDWQRRGFITEPTQGGSRSTMARMNLAQANQFARALDENDFELKEAIQKGEEHTSGKAILARCTFHGGTASQRQLTGYRENPPQDRTGFEDEHGQTGQRQWDDQDDWDNQNQFQSGKTQRAGQVVVEVVCVKPNETDRCTVVTISPENGEVIDTKNVSLTDTRRTRSDF